MDFSDGLFHMQPGGLISPKKCRQGCPEDETSAFAPSSQCANHGTRSVMSSRKKNYCHRFAGYDYPLQRSVSSPSPSCLGTCQGPRTCLCALQSKRYVTQRCRTFSLSNTKADLPPLISQMKINLETVAFCKLRGQGKMQEDFKASRVSLR